MLLRGHKRLAGSALAAALLASLFTSLTVDALPATQDWTPGTFAPPADGGKPYVALGDSYSSGEGLGPFYGDSDAPGVDTCHRSPKAYPIAVARSLRLVVPPKPGLLSSSSSRALTFAACSGNVTQNLDSTDGGNAGFLADGAQQLDQLGPSTKWVTLTIGGNDVGFGDILRSCQAWVSNNARQTSNRKSPKLSLVVQPSRAALYDPSVSGDTGLVPCHTRIADAQTLISGTTTPPLPSGYQGSSVEAMVQRLEKVYRTILTRAPSAQLAVGTYPQLFPTSFTGIQTLSLAQPASFASHRYCKVAHIVPPFTALHRINVPGYTTSGTNDVAYLDTTVQQFNALEAGLNGAIRSAVAELQTEGWNRIRLADLDADQSHPIDCGPKDTAKPYINGALLAFPGLSPWVTLSTASFHPNGAGQKSYAPIFEAALANPAPTAPRITSPTGTYTESTGTSFQIPLTEVGGTPTDEFGNSLYSWALASGLPPQTTLSMTGNTVAMTIPSAGTWPMTIDLWGPAGVVASSQFTVLTATATGPGTWSVPTAVEKPNNGGQNVSCSSASFCIAVDGNGDAAQYDGQVWSSPHHIDDNSSSSVSCVSSTFCVAVDGGNGGTSGGFTLFNGASWTSSQTIDASPLTSISCVSTSFCVAVDSQGDAATFDGTTWSTPTEIDPSAFLVAVSCAAPTFCVAVDFTGAAMEFDGITWSHPATIIQTGSFRGGMAGVSCPTQQFCLAIDSLGQAAIYQAGTWSFAAPPAVVPVLKRFSAVSCASENSCLVTGPLLNQTGMSGVITFDGSSWSSDYSHPGYVASLSCVDVSFCAELDSFGNTRLRIGGAWTDAVATLPVGNLTSVSCPTSTFCVAVDSSGHATDYNGSTWTRPQTIDLSGGLSAVSCPSATFCLAVDQSGNTVTFDGTNWSPPLTIYTTGLLITASCASPTFCVAIGRSYLRTGGDVLTWTSSGWSEPTPISPPTDIVDSINDATIDSLSCTPPTFCAATGPTGGNVAIYDGIGWTHAQTDSAAQVGGAVSCTSPIFCAAATGDDVITYDGSSWSTPTLVDPNDGIGYVSCTSNTFCVAVTEFGDAFSFDGTVWSAPTNIDVGQPLLAVSCATTKFCVAIDANNNAVVGRS